MELLPEGTVIAYDDSVPELPAAGSQYRFKFNWNGDLSVLNSWNDATNHGNIDEVHAEDGNTGFLVGVGVIPEYRNKYFEHNLDFPGTFKISE